jgi:hypothetical protein
MLINYDREIYKDKLSNIKIHIYCSICKKQLSFPVQCLECKNYFCKLCIKNWIKNNSNIKCPFKCNNPSYKSINIQYINNYNIEENFEKVCLLKKYKEFESNFNINNNRDFYFLNNSFKSEYHRHCLYNSVLNKYGWICDICNKEFEVRSKGRYRCDYCDFDICIKCKMLEESGYKFENIFLSKYHEHLLRDETLRENNWICDVCDKRFEMKTMKRFRCETCDFDICDNCKINEIKKINGIIYNTLIGIFYFFFMHN